MTDYQNLSESELHAVIESGEKALKNILRIKVPPGLPSNYRLRNSPHEENLSTFEAIARAIGILESKDIQAELEKLFLISGRRIAVVCRCSMGCLQIWSPYVRRHS